MACDDQRFISRGFPAPPLPEDFPLRLGRLEDRSGLPPGGVRPPVAAARRPGDGVAFVANCQPPTSCGPLWSGPARWTAAWR